MIQPSNTRRLLAIALSYRGFGFAVLEGQSSLIAYGGRVAKENKNVIALAKAKKLVTLYQPDVVVLSDVTAEGSRRAPRIKSLHRQMLQWAKRRQLKVATLSGKQLRTILLGEPQGTKQELAQKVAAHFPEELAARLPPRRRPWMSEDHRMGIFDAVALGLAQSFRKQGGASKVTAPAAGLGR